MDKLNILKTFFKSMYGLAFLCVVFTVSVYLYFHQRNINALIDQAANSYVQGEQAVSRYDRQQLFNATLQQYLAMEQEYNPTYGSGKLYFNIASTLFQLEEYPLAILYNYKTLKLRPGDAKAVENLQVIGNRIGLKPVLEQRSAFDMVFMQGTLSLPVRLQLFSLFLILMFAGVSWMLWRPTIWNRLVAVLCGVLGGYFALSVLYTQFFVPVEGVLVTSSPLYRDAGAQYAKVVDEPVVSGSKVEVLDVTPNGDWVKVMTPEGNLGYVPMNTMRMI